ncbi:putative oxidoreductase [Hordeum vulgare]|nr:putative oxidoreductase [Hordeum vulgare]
MNYELGGTTFETGATSDLKPSKKKKAKPTKVRGLAFSTFEDILLVNVWLATTMDSIYDIEQNGIKYGEKIWKEYHHPKEYVEPHPIARTHNVASLNH